MIRPITYSLIALGVPILQAFGAGDGHEVFAQDDVIVVAQAGSPFDKDPNEMRKLLAKKKFDSELMELRLWQMNKPTPDEFWRQANSVRRQIEAMAGVPWDLERKMALETLATVIFDFCNSDYYKRQGAVDSCIEQASSPQGPQQRAKEPRGLEKPGLSVALSQQPSWPTWSAPAAAKPPRAFPSAVNPSQLFKLLGPSVYVVRSTRKVSQGKDEVSLGSAVAVSRTEAFTNCHVVDGISAISLSHGSKVFEARVVAADRPTDRCILSVVGGELQPVLGLRNYSELTVGETVYTIGSPRGLDNTLGQGLISGLREANNGRLIQITAPISRGSSGGGLFDDRGNLIGVTAFTLRDSQNLNFAIAASDYWK